ncbi:hypothetical protein BDV40DRAFT_283822 [Aspergillus tamarii]|uniref:Uncharacterized protein n=1 Tax=Aspergillus tamarii TaxID=41984 RepID=A0A5N6U9V8_ASPTM|nr:hypothetical protein BDV40DRAFT_283822 [Aspergillus tamarii]
MSSQIDISVEHPFDEIMNGVSDKESVPMRSCSLLRSTSKFCPPKAEKCISALSKLLKTLHGVETTPSTKTELQKSIKISSRYYKTFTDELFGWMDWEDASKFIEDMISEIEHRSFSMANDIWDRGEENISQAMQAIQNILCAEESILHFFVQILKEICLYPQEQLEVGCLGKEVVFKLKGEALADETNT